MDMSILSQTTVRGPARGVFIALVVVSAVLMGDMAVAGENSLTFSAQGESRLTITRNGEVHRVARTFSVAEPPNPDGDGTMTIVLDETIDTVTRPGIDGHVRSRVRTKLTYPHAGSRRASVVIDANGSVTETRDHLYFVVEPACCDELRAAHVFSIYSGKELFAVSGSRLEDVTAELTFVSSPRLVRHLAVHSPGAPDDLRVYGATETSRGRAPVVVTWASWKEPIMKVFIARTADGQTTEGKTKPAELRVESVQWDNAEKNSPRRKVMGYGHQGVADPKVISGIGVLLHFSDGGVARLPIEADRIDVERSTFPRGVTARIAPR